MKPITTLLLFIIAAGVGYLAFSEYQKRQALADMAERMSDPKGWLAKEWSKLAKLKCDLFLDVETETARSGERPTSFTCYSQKTGFWSVTERKCLGETTRVATGHPREDGQVFKPYHVICWDVASKTE